MRKYEVISTLLQRSFKGYLEGLASHQPSERHLTGHHTFLSGKSVELFGQVQFLEGNFFRESVNEDATIAPSKSLGP